MQVAEILKQELPVVHEKTEVGTELVRPKSSGEELPVSFMEITLRKTTAT